VNRIVLASASPRRAELLRAAGIEFDVMPADVDETPRPGESPEPYVRRIAEAKAHVIAAHARNRVVIAADTTVVIDGAMLGKPVNDQDATRMLYLLSGRTHEVLTAVAVYRGLIASAPRHLGPSLDVDSPHHAVTPLVTIELERTEVEFAPLTEFEIDWYVATGEPRDKAGAYAIQGYASRFVTRINGSYANVVGLPVALVYEMLKGITTL
jgi:septum formation protein